MPDPTTPPPVTQDQAVDILKIASAYDGRKPSELQATVWAADLTDGHVAVQDAAQAVRTWYRDNPDGYIKPGHVVAAARAVRRERAERDRTAEHLALMAGRPEAGSPEAGGVLRRLAENMRRTQAAANQVINTRETRPCRVERGHPPTACTGTLTMEPGASGGRCDVCGAWEIRFATGYTLADRGLKPTYDLPSRAVVDPVRPNNHLYDGDPQADR